MVSWVKWSIQAMTFEWFACSNWPRLRALHHVFWTGDAWVPHASRLCLLSRIQAKSLVAINHRWAVRTQWTMRGSIKSESQTMPSAAKPTVWPIRLLPSPSHFVWPAKHLKTSPAYAKQQGIGGLQELRMPSMTFDPRLNLESCRVQRCFPLTQT